MASLTPERRSVNRFGSTSAEKVTSNLMNDKRIFRGHVHNVHNIRQLISPKDQTALQSESDQLAKLRSQIENFKKRKHKLTPYDLRPPPPPRVPVNLHYHLTEWREKHSHSVIGYTQTDEFKPKPLSPPFVPKKTGINCYTQVWDGELFSFDEESYPIVSVLLVKTLEESLEEVQEEQEMINLNNEFVKMKEMNDWKLDLENKVLRNEEKALLEVRHIAQKRREHYTKLENHLVKAEDVALAKRFLSKLIPQTVKKAISENVVFSKKEQSLKNNYFQHLVQRLDIFRKKDQGISGLMGSMVDEINSSFIESRRNKVKEYKEKAHTENLRNINFSDNARLLSFLYVNENYTPLSEFKARFPYILNHFTYVPPLSDQQLVTDEELKTPSKKNKNNDEEEVIEIPKFRTINIDSMSSLSFCLANHPFLDIPKNQREYSLYIETFSKSSLLGNSCPGIYTIKNARNITQKYSDDEKIVVNIHEIPAEVQHIFFYVKKNESMLAAKYARFHLDDYTNSQKIDYYRILEPKSYLAYRIYRQDEDPRSLSIIENEDSTSVIYEDSPTPWLLDIYDVEIQTPFNEFSDLIQKIVQESFEYTEDLTNQLISYRTKKFLELKQYEERKKAIEEAVKARGQRGRLRMDAEPKGMTPYIPPPFQHPTRPFGPFSIDLINNSLEDIKNLVRKETQSLEEEFDNELEITIRNRELTSVRQIKKARNLFHLQIREKIHQEVFENEEQES